jgi:hypothetical protein
MICSLISINAQFSGPLNFTAPLSGDGCVPDALNRTVRIGVFYSSVGYLQPYGYSALVVAQTFINYRNALCGAGGLGMPVELIACDMQSNNDLIPACATYLNNANLTAILLPEGPSAGFATASLAAVGFKNLEVAGQSGIPSVFVGSNGKRVYPNVFGVLTPAPEYFSPFLTLMRSQGYSTVAIVTRAPNDQTADSEACMGAIPYLSPIGMRLVYSVQIDIATNDTTAIIYDKITAGLAAAMAYNPDVLISGFGIECDSLFAGMVALNFNPQAHGSFECLNAMSIFPSIIPIATYAFSPLQWDVSLVGEPYIDADPSIQPYANLFPPNGTLSSPQIFMNAYDNTSMSMTLDHSIIPITSLAVGQLAALYLIDYAVSFSNGIIDDPDTMIRSAQSANFDSVFGRVSADNTGQNTACSMPQQQVINNQGDYIMVSPPIGLAILPMPTFAERVFIEEFLQTTIEQVFLGIGSVSNVICLVYIFLIVKNRSHASIKAQSIPFCIFLLLGCIVLPWAVFTRQLTADESQCMAELPIWILVVIFVLGPISIPSWRIHAIVNSRNLSVKSISDWKLFGIMLLQMSGLIVAMLASLIGNDMHPTVIVVDQNRPSFDYVICTSTTNVVTNIAFFAMAWTLGVLIFTLYIAFRNLNGDLLKFNNSGKLSILSLMIGLMMVLGGVITFAIPDSGNQQLKFGIMAGLSNFVAIFTPIMYFFDPLSNIKDNPYAGTEIQRTRMDSHSPSEEHAPKTPKKSLSDRRAVHPLSSIAVINPRGRATTTFLAQTNQDSPVQTPNSANN